jgi:hypothetical protein
MMLAHRKNASSMTEMQFDPSVLFACAKVFLVGLGISVDTCSGDASDKPYDAQAAICAGSLQTPTDVSNLSAWLGSVSALNRWQKVTIGRGLLSHF